MLNLLRSPRLRGLSLLLQVVALCCQLVEGTGREHCPHHDMGAAAPDMAMVMAMGSGHQGHAADTSGGHSCRCLGDCHSSLAALPAPTVAALPGLAVERAVVVASYALVAVVPQFRLPPALGPPLSV